MSKDEQEAQSKKYGNEVIILLPLASGNVAVFNSARELCGIVTMRYNYDPDIPTEFPLSLDKFRSIWFPPKARTEHSTDILTHADALPKEAIDVLKKAGLL